MKTGYSESCFALFSNTEPRDRPTALAMPSDDFFGFSVLIAGRPVPEYAKDGRVYVESNLYAPFSYRQKTEQLVNGEMEIESAPVTPYQVQIRLASHCEDSAVFVYVDGVLASKFMMEQAQSK